MALDEALLERAAEAGRLRRTSDLWLVDSDAQHRLFPAPCGVEPKTSGGGRSPLVRRATGGGAIWHHHELTYSLVLPPCILARAPHRTLPFRTLGDRRDPEPAGSRGQAPGRVSPPAPRGSSRRRPFLCFADRDPEDLVCGAFKVVGRRSGGGRGRSCSTVRCCSTLADGRPNSRGVGDLFEVEDDPQLLGRPDRPRRSCVAWAAPGHAEEADSIRRRAAELERTIYGIPHGRARP